MGSEMCIRDSVNGRRVDGSVTLRDGDVVTVGQTELLFFGGTGGRA